VDVEVDATIVERPETAELGVRFAMGVGGTFDVVAGKVRRAPRWVQRIGMEWLFRVVQEPRRMWKRYLVTNCRFVKMLWLEKRKRRSLGAARGPGT